MKLNGIIINNNTNSNNNNNDNKLHFLTKINKKLILQPSITYTERHKKRHLYRNRSTTTKKTILSLHNIQRSHKKKKIYFTFFCQILILSYEDEVFQRNWFNFCVQYIMTRQFDSLTINSKPFLRPQ